MNSASESWRFATGESVPYDINDAGQVVGVVGERAFLWQAGVMLDLGTLPGGDESTAYAINEDGVVVGESDHATSGVHGFIWADGVMADIGAMIGPSGSSHARDINADGFVVGDTSTPPIGEQRAFRWIDGDWLDLPTLGGRYSAAYGINEAGQIVGWSRTEVEGGGHAFLWDAGVLTDLGVPPKMGSAYALAINEDAVVVGRSSSEVDRVAWLWDGEMHALPDLPGWMHSHANDVNNEEVAVGWSGIWAGIPDFDGRAVVWQRGQVVDLNARIPPNPCWLLLEATAINDLGQIVGYGRFGPDGENLFRGFLLTPADSPLFYDLDCDGKVGFGDLLLLLLAWGECDDPDCFEDIDRNGSVGITDLLIILSNWTV